MATQTAPSVTQNYEEFSLAVDLNRKVVSKDDNRVVGLFGEVIAKESGERIINLCEAYN